MSADTENRFDRYVRSVVRDAEEKVPSGVWEAVSGKIAPEHRRNPVWLWWPAMAAAAAACALLLTVSPETVESDGAQRVDLLSLNNAPARETLVAGLQRPRAIPAGKVLAAPVPENPFVVKETPAAAQEKMDESVAACPEEEQAEVSKWEELLFEEEGTAYPARPLSVTVGGLLGANDSRLYGFASMPSYAEVPQPGTINEESVPVYGIPLSFAIGVRIPLSGRLSLGTGLSYTMLSRTFKGSYKTESGDMTHRMQYVGIPVNLNLDVFSTSRFAAYITAGVEAEKCITNRYWFLSKSPDPVYQSKVGGIQMSAGLGAGIQYNITKVLGIYIDPGFRYYFDCNQPKSVRTDKPLMFNMEAGLRFNL